MPPDLGNCAKPNRRHNSRQTPSTRACCITSTMSRLSSWFRPAAAAPPPAPTAKDIEKTARDTAKTSDMDDALASAGLMMNDDIDGAVAALQGNDSVFHGLGLGVTSFMRAVLGFEKEVMNEASARLTDVETRAWNELKAAQRRGEKHSTVYASGTEYSLVAAQSQLMSAVISVLHESLTEGIKGFYRLRKAYLTLDAIIEAEGRVLGQGTHAVVAPHEAMPGTFDDDEFKDLEEKEKQNGSPEDSDPEFVDAKETPGTSGMQTPLDSSKQQQQQQDAEKKLADLKLESKTDLTTSGPQPTRLTNPLDIFIYSGSNMCFGTLLLLLSMIPPAMSRLLSIIGFRGDRERGIRMLWNATRFHNVNGAVSGLALLGYYNGILGTADIIPPRQSEDNAAEDDIFAMTEAERETVGVPAQKCRDLLTEMRSRYPASGLWRLEEARGLAQERRLPEAIEALTKGEQPRMRQVAALTAFELALDAMFAQDWLLTRDSFLRCLELNDWSHCLYYYIAGCAELERYRDAVLDNIGEEEVKKRKTRAEELLRRAPTVAGRKKFMSKQLPFDVFVQRKVAKLEERAKELGVSLVDAAGPSPALEMAALWCGTKRMAAGELAKMEAGLAWERCTAPEAAVETMRATADERAVRAVTLAAVCRCQGRVADARKLLDDEVFCHDKNLLKGGNRDDYALPNAHYELAALAWFEAAAPPAADVDAAATKARRVAKAKEAQGHLDTVVAWEPFLFDARLGMRVQAGVQTLKWFQDRLAK
ncbi:breast cancer protein [Plectosphaerella plurivora]|uniref:Inclusion body clearance protein IML2 n=1 Tax=Plectosphaerella plurivora TaxID=936078 RepID=A0A9P9A7Z1_9PEZI|nr:breast cancer protein [Plectosphaerella plurivora]